MKVFSSLLFLLMAAGSHAQTAVKWDSTFRPPSYDLRVAQFKMFPNSKKDIIFLGNSITAGVEWQELLGNPNVRNRGISGDITFGVLARLNEITEGKPAKVFILIGINDVAKGIPDSVTSANHRRIVQYIKLHSPGTKIYLQTLLPVNKDFGKHAAHYNKDEMILRINENLKKLAQEEKVELIDLYSKFLNSSGKLTDKYTYDGLHLTAEGYKHWSEILKESNAL
jgi:lysophospholipase L1-like esterase